MFYESNLTGDLWVYLKGLLGEVSQSSSEIRFKDVLCSEQTQPLDANLQDGEDDEGLW